MSESNFQKQLLEELLLFFDPVVRGAASPERVYELIGALGWNGYALFGPPPNAVITAWAAAAAAIVEIERALIPPPESLVDLTKSLGAVDAVARAIAALPPAFGQNQPGEIDSLVGDLFELLTLRYLRARVPVAVDVLRFLTIVRDEDRTAVSKGSNVARRATTVERLELDRIPLLLVDPAATLRDHYLPGGLATNADATMAAMRIFPIVAALLGRTGARAIAGSGAGMPLLDEAAEAARNRTLTAIWELVDDPAAAVELGISAHIFSAEEQGPGVLLAPFGAGELEFVLGAWRLALSLAAGAGALAIKSSGIEAGLGEAGFDAALTLSRSTTDGSPMRIGSASGTRLEVGMVSFTVEGGFHHPTNGPDRVDYGGMAHIQQAALVITAGDGDGFLQKVLPPEGFRIQFDFGVGWSSAKGLYFQGSAGLEATLPLHLNLFEVLKIESVYLAILTEATTGGAPSIELGLATSIGLSLGPLDANVDRIGLRAILTFPKNGGNLGVANIELAFRPPRSVGFVIDASAFVGGGFVFFDPEASQYGGILQIEVKGTFSIKAICLITTRMPDGSPGFSLLIIVAVEFSPIQLGYGFTLNGVGGLAGLNRTMKVDPLRDGIKNRTLDSIMFPPDPIKNAQRIISDLTAIFPPAPDRFVFAPMVKFGWGAGMLLIEVGLIVELPSPLRLAIMGKLHVKLPPLESGEGEESKNLVELHLDVLGILDFDRGEISVDAVLYNSRLVIFPITGGMAMRLRWGNDPIFLMAIGGLNPRFPLPPAFPIVDRLGINLSYDQSGFKACLRLETYLAVTPNSLQFGARIDAYAEFAVARIAGFLGFDALIEFTPFHFIVDLYAGVVVQAFGFSFGVDLLLVFSGPGPFLGEGHATVQFLGKHEFPVRFVIGEDREETPLLPVDPLPELVAALEDVRNWSAAVPAGNSMLLTMRQLTRDEQGTKLLAHPLGELTVRQKVLPFGIALDLFGAAPPMSPGPYDVASVQVGTRAGVAPSADRTLRDTFARGQFVAMSEDEKATSPGFESFRCGLTRLGADAVVFPSAAAQEAVFEYDVTVIDDKENPSSGRAVAAAILTCEHFLRAAEFGAARQSPMTGTGSTKFAGQAKGIRVRKPQHRVADRDGLTPSGGAFASYTEAEAASQGAPGDWQIVDEYEVA